MQFLTAEALAARLGVKAATVWAMSRDGRIPTIRISHRCLRFDVDDVMRALKKPPAAAPAEPAVKRARVSTTSAREWV
jgi:excisionase family DNA binding protein